ncbi:MAG: class I SAM-dependent methyltransferase [Candidatus Omnitrophica bacterium]|nr:class I SAM-dependent methyltransferase [Candidatus Omnitrophota bacterium]
MRSQDKKLIERGIKVGDTKIFEQDKVWSRYSNDKVNIGEELAKVIRVLNKALPLTFPITALSIGSSNEPQFRILETACRGGLYLLDIEKDALEIVKERIARQHTNHVFTVLSDFDKMLLNAAQARMFLKNRLHSKKINLITLHHSLYYCNEGKWGLFFNNLYRYISAPVAAFHAVLMAPCSDDPCTTSWIYDHFVGKYFGCKNRQDLFKLKDQLQRETLFKKTQIFFKKNRVYFYVDDFEKFMSVIWMIMLYPNVHQYSLKEREEITEFVYKRLWIKKKPLVQVQDHMVIYKGIRFKGLI